MTMDFDQSNEEHLKILEEYIKRFHEDNFIKEEQCNLLAKLNSY